MINEHEIIQFHFIRHGPVVKQAGHLPAYDAPLIEQDYDLADLIETLPKNADWHVSPLQRARQTAAILSQTLLPRSQNIVPNLAEQDFGDWHDQPIADIWPYLDAVPKHNWAFMTADFCPPNGESFATQMRRMAAWCKSQERGSFDTAQIIVAHAGTIRAVIAHILGLSADNAQAIEISHFGGLHASLMPAKHDAKHRGGAWQIHRIA